jgi:GxxExxY protein
MTENEIAKVIVDAAFKVHTTLGPGLLESVYEDALAHELAKRGLKVVREQAVPVIYDTIQFEEGFRLDLLVEDKVVVEIKSVEKLHPVHHKQVQTYLRLADKRLGLLINFGEALIKNGIKRVVNGLKEETPPAGLRPAP